jgi:starvation-inducible DNA-binding protein
MTHTTDRFTEVGGALDRDGALIISGALQKLLADVFALYLKTKNFHWHISGPHFRDYHLLLDEQASQIFDMTDEIAERTRKIGGTTLRSIGDIARHQRLKDSDEPDVAASAMLTILREDNVELTAYLRATHALCAEHNDVATTSLIESWIDQAERRTWFLVETLSARCAG